MEYEVLRDTVWLVHVHLGRTDLEKVTWIYNRSISFSLQAFLKCLQISVAGLPP
jgi:hypothetical protein